MPRRRGPSLATKVAGREPAAPRAFGLTRRTILTGVSFDLSALSKLTEGGDTTAFDRVQTGQSDYLYTFGICHRSPKPPRTGPREM